MRVLHLCCIGRSHRSYRVIAIRDERDKAVAFLEGEVGDTRKELVGFVLPWILDGGLSEELDFQFVWDTRLQAKVVKKPGVF